VRTTSQRARHPAICFADLLSFLEDGMASSRRTRRKRTALIWVGAALMAGATACDSKLIREAKEAEDEGAVIDNDMMAAMHPQTFRRGSPAYLERDFEAGADFICAEIKAKHRRDLCSEPEINWK